MNLARIYKNKTKQLEINIMNKTFIKIKFLKYQYAN